MSADEETGIADGTASVGADAERRGEELRRPASLSLDGIAGNEEGADSADEAQSGAEKEGADSADEAQAGTDAAPGGRKSREDIENQFRNNPVFATFFDKTQEKKKKNSAVLITVGGLRLTLKRILILSGFFFVVLLCLCACLFYAFSDIGKIRDYTRANALFEKGDFEGAKKMFIKVLGADPNKEDALEKMARIYNHYGDWNNEAFFRQRLMRLNPLKKEYFHDFMESSFRARNFSVIYSHFQLKDGNELLPEEGALFMIAALRSKHVQEGKTFYDERVKQDPDYFSGTERGRFVELLLKPGEMDSDRVREYKAFLETVQDPQIRFETIDSMLRYFEGRNDEESLAEMEKLLREAAGLNDFAGAHLLANFYFLHYRFDEAIEVCDEYLKTKMNASIPILFAESCVLGGHPERIPPLAEKLRAAGGRQSEMIASYLDALSAFCSDDPDRVWSSLQAAGDSIRTPLSSLMKLQVAIHSGSPAEILKTLKAIMDGPSFMGFKQRARTAALEYLMSVPDKDILNDPELLKNCAEIARLIQTKDDNVSFLRRIIILDRFKRNVLKEVDLLDALHDFPHDIVLLRIASEFYLRIGQPDQAMDRITEYNLLDIPNKPSIAVLHVKALYMLGRNEDAEKEFRELLKSSNDDSLLFPYYELCCENGFIDPLKFLEKWLGDQPQKSAKRSALPFVTAEIRLAEGKKEQALDLFAKSKADDPRFVFHAASRLAENGRTDAAIASCLSVKDTYPDKVLLNVRLSELYAAKGNAKSALEYARAAWQLNRADLNARRVYAKCLSDAGQYSDVISVLNFPQHREDFPEDMCSIWREAMLKALKADFDAARYLPALDKAKQLQSYFPDDSDVQEWRTKIEDARRQERRNGK